MRESQSLKKFLKVLLTSNQPNIGSSLDISFPPNTTSSRIKSPLEKLIHLTFKAYLLSKNYLSSFFR